MAARPTRVVHVDYCSSIARGKNFRPRLLLRPRLGALGRRERDLLQVVEDYRVHSESYIRIGASIGRPVRRISRLTELVRPAEQVQVPLNLFVVGRDYGAL